MLSRLGIRQKLSLLLLIPLAAVIVTMVPFTADRVDDARAAGTTARKALAAREIGGLIQTLQEERLLSLGYLAVSALDRSALVAQSQAAVDDTARLRDDPVTAVEMTAARQPVEALVAARERILNRAISGEEAYRVFRGATTALLEALGLIDPSGVDTQGVSQLAALEALMRSNEEASSAGAVLVAAAGDQKISHSLLTDAITADRQHISRFAELAPKAQSDLVAKVQQGEAGKRFGTMVAQMTAAGPSTTPVGVSEALTTAISYTSLRRLAQDRVARDIATAAENRASAAQLTALGVAGGAAAVLVVVIALGVTVSRSISQPLRRLTRAAGMVADLARAELIRVADSDDTEPAPPQLAAVDVSSADEIGELAVALNRVQATAALLLERQVTTRRNIAVMFANIARRTQTLVGRQLALVDDLERNERSPDLLQRLYRLDHVATRLRRSADSLLVVSGTVDQLVSGGPTPLVDVIRSALAEIEGFRAVRLGDVSDVTVSAGLVADLRLLLAELLENATNFSPPGTLVEVTATLEQECRIVIVDHGLGLSPARLDEENRRLVERERLDIAPTTALGLFVVGRLARRHGLTVSLEHSEGRGVTATVRIPPRLLSLTKALIQSAPGERGRHREPLAIESAEVVGVGDVSGASEPFAWFSRQQKELVAAPATVGGDGADAERSTSPDVAVGRASVAADPSVAALPQRKVVLSHEPMPTVAQAPARTHQPAVPAATAPPVTAATLLTTRSGLVRRIPGAHMVDEVRDEFDDSPTTRIVRDPEAEREALNDYLSGLTRDIHAEADHAQASQSPVPERQT